MNDNLRFTKLTPLIVHRRALTSMLPHHIGQQLLLIEQPLLQQGLNPLLQKGAIFFSPFPQP